MHKTLLACLSAVVVATLSRGQGFINLNFESARVAITTNIGLHPFITATNALPGWSAFSGTNQLSLIEYNPGPASVYPPVALVGSNAEVIGGNFSVLLGDNTGSISQTGVIPSNTESLFFAATSSSLLVTLGEQNLSYTAITTNPNYTLFGADISIFAGQVETLTFSDAPGGILDDIQFSSSPIPEPSGLALLVLGGAALVYLRARKRFWLCK